MKKYLIEFQRMFGQPDFIFATELNENGRMTNNRGQISNYLDFTPINIIITGSVYDKIHFEYEGVFEIEYHWRNWKKDWFKCDESKYNWCKSKHITTKITLKFIS